MADRQAGTRLILHVSVLVTEMSHGTALFMSHNDELGHQSHSLARNTRDSN